MNDTPLTRFNNLSVGRWSILGGFLFLALIFAALQIKALHLVSPSSDTIQYLDFADQIGKIGYVRALSDHWSPLYALYLFAVEKLFHIGPGRELFSTVVSFAVLLIAGCMVSALFIRVIGESVWLKSQGGLNPDYLSWKVYLFSFVLYLFFVVMRVSTRLPDALVFIFALLFLMSWCKSFQNNLSLKWAVSAGLFGGIAYWARSSQIAWVPFVGLCACVLCPMVSWKKRLAGFGAFLIVFFLVILPQMALLSAQKGDWSFGGGRYPLYEVYGATPEYGSWPVRLAGGDVRLYVEDRSVSIPWFYEPSRELEGRKLLFRPTAALHGVIQAVLNMLFGHWSPSYALQLPLFWSLWPFFVYGLRLGRRSASGLVPPQVLLWRRTSLFLIACGLGGVIMHVFSYLMAYYLLPYLFSFFAGLSLLIFEPPEAFGRDGHRASYVRRAFYVIGAGFVATVLISNLVFLIPEKRDAYRKNYGMDLKLARALGSYPGEGGLRKIATQNLWDGFYAIRLSGSQAYASIEDAAVLTDRDRLQKAVAELKNHGVSLLLLGSESLWQPPYFDWKHVEDTHWYILDLRNVPT